MKKIFKLFIVLLVFMAVNVKAKEVNHFYFDASENVEFSDSVNGSSVLAGESVEFEGLSDGVNFSFGNNVKINGQSEYGVIAGNNINIDGVFMKDVFIAGNIINLNNESVLNRDTVIFGSDIKISGLVNRNISLYGSKITFKGAKVNGNVKIYADNITVDNDTVISGKLSYPEDAKFKNDAVITEVVKTSPLQTKDDDLFDYFMGRVWAFLSLVLIFSLLTLVCSDLFEKIHRIYEKCQFNQIVETFSKGLVFSIVLPAIAIILLMFPFGLSLSFILLALYFIVMYLSKIFAGYFVGYKLWQAYLKSDINMLVVGIFGLAILFVLDCIPVINTLSRIFALFFGVGIIISLLKKDS